MEPTKEVTGVTEPPLQMVTGGDRFAPTDHSVIRKIARGVFVATGMLVVWTFAMLAWAVFVDFLAVQKFNVPLGKPGVESLLPGITQKAWATRQMIRADLSSTWTTNGVTNWYPINTADTIRLTCQSAAGSTANCLIEIATANTNVNPIVPGNPQTLYTIANPGVNELGYNVPRMPYVRCEVTGYVAGTLNCQLDGYSGTVTLY